MNGQEIELGFLAAPAQASRGGVVILHDVWGLYDHFREVAGRVADAGYTALALALYRRDPGLRVQDPGSFMRELDDRQVIADVAAACTHLHAMPELAGKRVAVMGFCMGGMYALLASSAVPGLAAVVPFYGILSHAHGLLFSEDGLDTSKKPTTPLAAAANARCPVLAFYGDQDPFVPLADIDELRTQLTRSGATHEVCVFPGAGHAFMNDTRPAAYRPADAHAAWQKMLRFLQAHVG